MSKGTLQTLERGLRVLELAAASPKGIAMTEIAAALDVHRTIAYRLVATLQGQGFVTRQADGRVYLGSRILAMAQGFLPQLRVLAQPMLQDLAAAAKATAFLSVAEGADCTVVAVEEYQQAVLQVGYRVGSRHPINLGAAGLAILAGQAPLPEEPAGVTEARARGYSFTQSQIQEGARGVASPVTVAGLSASMGIVSMTEIDVEATAQLVKMKAADLSKALVPDAEG